MTTTQEALRMAIEALDDLELCDYATAHKAIQACKEALKQQEPVMIPNIKDDRDEIYYAWRKAWASAVPGTAEGEQAMMQHGRGFQEGWRACEQWLERKADESLAP